jgi:hypothetical protein
MNVVLGSGQIEKGKSLLNIFSDIKGIVHKKFILTSQTVDSTYYYAIYVDCMKMREDFAPICSDKGTGCCIMTTHHLMLTFSPGNFLPKIT